MDTTNHRPDGIWIPFEILEARLDGVTLQIFMLVHSFTQNGKECYVSNEYLMEVTGCTLSKVKSSLAKLKELGWIVQTKFDGRRRYLASTLRWQLGFKQSAGDNSDKQPVENPTGRQSENQPHTINKNTINKNTLFSSSINIEEEAIPDFDQLINDPLPSQKEKNNAPGGRLHQQMVEVWNHHMKAKYSTSVAELSKLGIGKEMAALKKIREYLYTHHVNAGVLNPDEATLADFRYILENKHKAGQFYDRSELTHTARYLLDIIKGIKNQPKDKYGKIDINEALEGAKQFMRKLNGQSDTE